MSFAECLLHALGTIFYLILIETSEGGIGGVNGGAGLESRKPFLWIHTHNNSFTLSHSIAHI